MLTSNCPNCKYFETNGSDAIACRSPKWDWTEADNMNWLAKHSGQINQWSLKSSLPDFQVDRHCQFTTKGICEKCSEQEVVFIGSGDYCNACNSYV